MDGAKHCKSRVNCDALLLDDKSRSDTYPTIEVDAERVSIEHEASVSKISEEQLFYLMSRGLPEAEAAKMIVTGFIEPLVKELPMEYAVEMNRLIELEMEGALDNCSWSGRLARSPLPSWERADVREAHAGAKFSQDLIGHGPVWDELIEIWDVVGEITKHRDNQVSSQQACGNPMRATKRAPFRQQVAAKDEDKGEHDQGITDADLGAVKEIKVDRKE